MPSYHTENTQNNGGVDGGGGSAAVSISRVQKYQARM